MIVGKVKTELLLYVWFLAELDTCCLESILYESRMVDASISRCAKSASLSVFHLQIHTPKHNAEISFITLFIHTAPTNLK